MRCFLEKLFEKGLMERKLIFFTAKVKQGTARIKVKSAEQFARF